jgi:hypothetical protein
MHFRLNFAATPLSGPDLTRMVHQDLPHQAGGDPEQVRASL